MNDGTIKEKYSTLKLYFINLDMIIIVYFIVESLKKKWRDKNLD
jgi:hypothetical protein